jgi:hypothetical protein
VLARRLIADQRLVLSIGAWRGGLEGGTGWRKITGAGSGSTQCKKEPLMDAVEALMGIRSVPCRRHDSHLPGVEHMRVPRA